jgi:Ni2+-binding GTPase involved in maturation of urease and hydrogenase
MTFQRNLFNNKTLATLDGFKNIKGVRAVGMQPCNTYVKMFSNGHSTGCDIFVCDSRIGDDEWDKRNPNVLKCSLWIINYGPAAKRVNFKLSSAYGCCLCNEKQSFRELEEVTNYMIDTIKARV